MTTEEFEHIAVTLRPKLFRVAHSFFSDDGIAEDVVQETLMRLWLVRDRTDGTSGATALAVRMAKNICVSEWRKRKLRATTGLSAAITASDTRQGQTKPHAESQMEESDNRRILQQAISRLTIPEQRLFRMRHEADMEIGQIAAATGIQPRSVSAMLSAARRKLLAMIKQGGAL